MEQLQYNAFGVAVVSSTDISVTAAIIVDGQPRRRTFKQELEIPIILDVPVVLMLGAWIEKTGTPRIHVLELSGEDSEVALIPQVRSAIQTVMDALKLAMR